MTTPRPAKVRIATSAPHFDPDGVEHRPGDDPYEADPAFARVVVDAGYATYAPSTSAAAESEKSSRGGKSA